MLASRLLVHGHNGVGHPTLMDWDGASSPWASFHCDVKGAHYTRIWPIPTWTGCLVRPCSRPSTRCHRDVFSCCSPSGWLERWGRRPQHGAGGPPFHPECGWYVDHHLTNRPDEQEASSFAAEGGTQHWEATPSAARLAYELLVDITEWIIEPMMPVVDALDSGGISKGLLGAPSALSRRPPLTWSTSPSCWPVALISRRYGRPT